MRMTSILSLVAAVAAGFIIATSSSPVAAHCQIPCGIYDDPMRITMLREDAATIAKAVDTARTLDSDDYTSEDGTSALDLNQLIRWTTTKDEAATNIQRIVSDYFLTQRVKAVPAGEDGHDAYLDQLTKMHAILVAAMKCKQTVDPAAVATLKASIEVIAPMYVHEHDHDHGHGHDHGG